MARIVGDFERAKHHYLDGLRAYQTIGNRDGTSMVYNNLGVLCETQGLCEEAIAWHQKSLDVNGKLEVARALRFR